MNKLHEHGENTATQSTATSRAENSSCQQKQHHTNKLHEHAETTAIKKGYTSRRKLVMPTEATPHGQAK